MKKEYSKKIRIFMSGTALFLIVALAISLTFSWSEDRKTANVFFADMTVSAADSLTMKRDGVVTHSIVLPTTCKLQEVSSADGRNFFFPTTDNKTNLTNQMTFRHGVPEDKNTRYLSLDFQLEAGDSAIAVFLGAATSVQCDNDRVANALRMSLSKNDGSQPIVFKPTQTAGASAATQYNPIVSITDDGRPTTDQVFTSAFGDYSSDSNPLFSIESGQTLNVTLSVWLEGTEFSGNEVADSPLYIYIDFTTACDEPA